MWLCLVLEKNQLPRLLAFWQKGLLIPAQVGCSLKALLCGQFGLSPAYLQERIKTIFLNGKSVDDPDTAIIRSGSILALSGALPGLAGATLRRAGFLASFRSQLTHEENKTAVSPEDGIITVKLFNLLVDELGPVLLKRGVLLPSRDFAEFWKSMPGEFWKACRAAQVNGRKISVEELQSLSWLDKRDLIGLQVDFPAG